MTSLRGSWVKEGAEFMAQVRCGGHGAENVGRTAILRSQAKDFSEVTLTALVRDYGAGDVCLYRVSR